MTEMKSFYSDLLFWVTVCLTAMALWWTWRLGKNYVETHTQESCVDHMPWGTRCDPGQRMEFLGDRIVCRCPKTVPSASSSHP